jgi:hypothetical protein
VPTVTNLRHRRQQQQLTLIALEATRLPTLLAQAHDAIALTLPDGYPAGGGEPVSGGDVSNPTLHAVIERERNLESVEDRQSDAARIVGLAAVDTALTDAIASLRDAHHALTQLVARLHVGQPTQRTNMADCTACGRTVANTPADRLRAGYCAACHRAWTRAGRPDRPAFERTRTDTDDPPAQVHTSGATIDLTVAGVTVRLPPDLAAEWCAIVGPDSDDVARLHAAALERQ